MSYILDALKKLESEKAKKARSDGMMSISGALLRDEPRRRSGGKTWKIAAVVVAAVLFTCGATWFVLHGDKRKGHRMGSSVMRQTVPKVVPPAAAPPPIAAIQQPPPVAAIKPPPPTPPRTVPSESSAEPSKPQTAAPEASSAVNKKQTLRTRKQKTGEIPPVNTVKPSAPVLSPPPADIKVSGIAWQDERNARRAVVNGFLLHEGSVVSGARITEILRDRVRFSAGDKVFEAPLVMIGVPGTGK